MASFNELEALFVNDFLINSGGFLISCSEYDYIEIVCMYHYPIKLTMISNDIVKGIALDTQLNDFRAECIKVKVNGVDCLIELDKVIKLEISVKNPHFETIIFNQ